MNSHDAGKKKPSVQDAVARANWLARKEQGFAGLPGHGAGKHHTRDYDAAKGRGGKPSKHKQDWSAERYAEEPTLTQPLMTRPDYGNIDKEANMNYRKETISIPLASGKSEQVEAMVFGSWAIHKGFGSAGWTVTFAPTGQAINTRSKSLKDAKLFLETILEKEPSLIKAKSVGEVLQHKDLIQSTIRNPPSAGKSPSAPRVSDRRVDVIQMLRDAGLVSTGDRSGKAGEFFVIPGDTPAWAISVGQRDLLLNHFQLEQRLQRGYMSWTGRWVMEDAELLSKVTPELINKWVAILKKAPTRKQEQQNLEEKGNRMASSDLRSKLIRLAHANPALRADILPLLAPGVDVRLASLRVKTAYAPILKSKGLNKRSYGDGMGHMLFAIDQSRNESKFYEMLIVPEGSGWKLMRRWGALTDKLGTGRISEKDMYFDNEDDAKEEMQDIYREKTTGKSKYKDAFKVSNGEYPIGLNRSVGFGHGTQSAIRCIPALKQLRSEVGEIARDVEVVKVEDHTDLLPLFNRMTAAYKTIDDRMVDGDGTMKDTLKKMMNVPLQRVVGLVQTLERNPPRPGRPVVLDRQNLKEDLNKLYKYLDSKLSYC